MIAERNSLNLWTSSLFIAICLGSIPTYAKYGGGSGTPDDPYQIWTAEQMNAIGTEPNDWNKHFLLMADIDLGGYSGEQFNIIGRDLPQSLPFSGSFDGYGYCIRNFTYRSSSENSVGLFGFIKTGIGGPPAVRNLDLVDPNVDAGNAHGVSALVGQLFNGTISDCYVEGGRVSGFTNVGGLVGYTSPTNMAMERKIVDCRTSCQVSGDSAVGGIAGAVSAMACVLRCGSSGTVTGRESVGGLVGSSEYAQISQCGSSVRVIGKDWTGGLVGLCTGGPDAITACAASGSVDGGLDTGGLVGWNIYSVIADSYSVARVSGTAGTGGLVGANQGAVNACYAAGPVTGESQIGGLIGSFSADPFYPEGSATDSFWDTEASGQITSAGGTGKTTAEMQTARTYLDAGWDFVGETTNGKADIWRIRDGHGYPRLWWEPPDKYGGGSGTADDPYQIWTAEEMNEISLHWEDRDKHFKLMTDIDLADYPTDKYHSIDPFSGVFDGNGHTISHFTCTGGNNGVGLFGSVRDYVVGSNPVIKNLGLVDPNVQAAEGSVTGCLVGSLWGGTVKDCYVSGGSVTAYGNVGGLVGVNRAGTITGCHSTTTVSGYDSAGGLVGTNGGSISNSYVRAQVSSDGDAGGLVGINGISTMLGVIEGKITSCCSSGTVIGREEVGGLVGYDDSSFITDCYSTGDVTGDRYVGGLVGWLNLSSISRCYAIGRVTGTKNTGGLIPISYDHRSAVVASFWDVETSGQSISAGGVGLTTREMHDPQTFVAAGWHFIGMAGGPSDIWAEPSGGGYPILWWQLPQVPPLPTFSGGTGDPCDPYLIAAASDLNAIGYNPRLMDSHFRLIRDINLADTKFYPISDRDYPYSGTFDGGGFSISNLACTSKGMPCVGMFACIDGPSAAVANLRLIGPRVTADGGQYVGALVGRLRSGVIADCRGEDVVVNGGDYVGGLAGLSAGTITRCRSFGTVTGNAFVGGLLGVNDSGSSDNRPAVTSCCSGGSVIGGRHTTGGLIGSSAGIVADSYSRCDVTGSLTVGGLVGRVMSIGSFPRDRIVNCYSSGHVNGSSYVGGLLGYCDEGIARSFWDMQTSGQSASAGGTGLTTAEMQTAKTFLDAGWDFVGETASGTEEIWWIDEGKDYPRLWWETGEE